MAKPFSAQVADFGENAIAKTEAVFKQSVQDMDADAQTKVKDGGRMRVKTGFLRNSHVSGLTQGMEDSGVASITVTLGKFKLGQTVYGGWTAEYAVHREYGSRGQAPDFFLRGAAQKWQSIVNKNAALVRNK